MTFSIVARLPGTGGAGDAGMQYGIAIASSSPAVAARCAHVRAGVGAVASQNVTDPRLGPAVLNLIEGGESASAAIEAVVASRSNIDHRQLAAIDARGRTSA